MKKFGPQAKNTSAGLSFTTNGRTTGHASAQQAPLPHGRSYSEFPASQAPNSKPRAQVVGGKVHTRVVSEHSVNKTL